MPNPPYVYIVDDDEDDQFLLRQAFKSYCPHTHLKVVSNGLELLGSLQLDPHLPQLLLLDLNMPIMGGFEALVRVRQMASYELVPIVILTTSDQLEDQHLAYRLKANGFVTKPSSLQQYRDLVLLLSQEFLDDQ